MVGRDQRHVPHVHWFGAEVCASSWVGALSAGWCWALSAVGAAAIQVRRTFWITCSVCDVNGVWWVVRGENWSWSGLARTVRFSVWGWDMCCAFMWGKGFNLLCFPLVWTDVETCTVLNRWTFQYCSIQLADPGGSDRQASGGKELQQCRNYLW